MGDDGECNRLFTTAKAPLDEFAGTSGACSAPAGFGVSVPIGDVDKGSKWTPLLVLRLRQIVSPKVPDSYSHAAFATLAAENIILNAAF